MVYKRQGEWQTGYVQRTIPTFDLKQDEKRVKDLKQQSKEEIAKREKSNKQIEAEAQRIFNLRNGLDAYDATKAANMSATFKDFMVKTVASLAKTAQDEARARGAAAADADDGPDTEGSEVDEEELKKIKAAADQNLKTITDMETKLATPLEQVGEKEKAQKARGLFSDAYNWGYKIQRGKLAVDGFAPQLSTFLDTSEQLLQRTEDSEPWKVKDAGNDKNKLRFASAWYLNKFEDEYGEDFNPVTLSNILTKPAKKHINKELHKRFEGIDLEFNENKITAINNSLAASLEGIPGSTNLSTEIASYWTRMRPYVSATKEKSKGAVIKENLINTYTQVIARAKDPLAVKKAFIAVASKLEIDSSMGKLTLEKIDASKFSVGSLENIYNKERAKRWSNAVNQQKSDATDSILNKSKEVEEKMAEDPSLTLDSFSGELITFQAALLKEFPYARGDITNMMGKYFRPKLGKVDTLLEVKRLVREGNGVIKAADLADANVDMKVVDEYVSDHNIEIVEETYTEKNEDYVKDKERDIDKLFAKEITANGIAILSGNHREAAEQFTWEVHQLALQKMKTAKEADSPITYVEAFDSAFGEKEIEFNEGKNNKNSKWYLDPGNQGKGFLYFDQKNIDPFYGSLDDIKAIDTINSQIGIFNKKKLMNKSWITDPARLDINENTGYSDDPLVRKLSQIFGVSEEDFRNAQVKALPKELQQQFDVGSKPTIDIVDKQIKTNKNNSTAAGDLSDMQSKGNSDSTVANRAVNEILPLNYRTLSNVWSSNDEGWTSEILINEVTGPGLMLPAGKVLVGDYTQGGVKHVGHKVIGVTSGFGPRVSPTDGASTNHPGIDIGTTKTQGWETAMRIQDGVIVGSYSDAKTGVTLEIQDSKGNIWKIAHLKTLNPELTVGSKYNGQIIGEIGTTGVSTGEHLHIEKSVNGEPVDWKDELGLVSIGKRYDQEYEMVGKYPIRRGLIPELSRLTGLSKSGINYKEFLRNESKQKVMWDYLSYGAWQKAIKASPNNQAIAIRMYVADILTGDPNNYTQPTIWSYSDNYLEKLRTDGVLK